MTRRIPVLFLLFALMLGAGLGAGLGACTPIKATRGNYVEDSRLAPLEKGVSTKDEVAQRLGTPTTVDPFNSNIWFYIGEKTSTTAFFDPKVDTRKILKLTFDDKGLLQSAQKADEKTAQQIETVKKQTPAAGREMNAFEQFLSNLGKFNQTPPGMGDSGGRSQGK